MAHIHTQPGQHDHTVTAYIVRTDSTEPKILLHMHKKLGRLLTIGGHIELDETPWQAIAHELQEESGYSLNELLVLQPKERLARLSGVVMHPYPVVMNTHNVAPSHDHSDTGYAFVATANPAGQINKGESTDLRWLTRSELEALDEADLFLNVKEAYLFVLDVCLKNWDRVSPSFYKQ